jgi:hypothetical protein
MSTSPAASPIALNNPPQAPIDLTDPRLHEPNDDHGYWPVDITSSGLVIAARYHNLKLAIQQAILSLWEAGHESAAMALAMCGKHGSVYKRCKKGNAAGAHRHTCHLYIDDYCGKPINLLRCWLRWRRPEVRTERQWGIQLQGPIGSDLPKLASKISRWLRDRGMASTFRIVMDPALKCEAVRMVVRSDKSPYVQVIEHLHKITKNAVGYSGCSHYESTPVRVLEWMMAATEPLLRCCGHTRARYYLKYFRKQIQRSTGDFYAEREDAQPEYIELQEEAEGHAPVLNLRCDCGECDGVMEFITWEQRTTQPVEKIVDQYKHVEWTSCYDPFRVRRISHKEQTYVVFDGNGTGAVQEGQISRAGPS